MSRAVRKVPPDWVHPKDKNREYIPLLSSEDYGLHTALWDEEAAKWRAGLCRTTPTAEWIPMDPQLNSEAYAEWAGERPRPSEYMPEWPATLCTHWQMYEEVTEGTPISPVCSSPEKLARWLADHEANAFADTRASYQDWLSLICRGPDISGVVSSDGVKAGFVSTPQMISQRS